MPLHFQVGLVDVLLSVGISPDHVLAHSLGDFGCAYADGSLSLEQTILAAYYTGLALAESNCIRGAMLAVGKFS